jgi:hypothetical protein
VQAQVRALRIEFLSLIAPFVDTNKFDAAEKSASVLQQQGLSKGSISRRNKTEQYCSLIRRIIRERKRSEQYCSIFAIQIPEFSELKIGRPVAANSTKTAEAGLPTGGVAAVAPAPK